MQLVRRLSLGALFARSSFSIMLAHRVRYLIGIVNYVTYVAVKFLTGLCAAYTEKLQGFLWAKFMLLQFLSGLLLPLSFFPPSVRNVFNVLPFKGLADTPMNIYLGRFQNDVLGRELMLQTAW